MKTINKLMILLMIIGLVQTGNIEAQSLKDLRNKAKNVKVKKTEDKTTTTTTKTTTETNKKTTETNQNETTEKQELEALVIDPNNPVFVEYESLFKKMTLDPASGEFKIEKISLKNLPEANIGTRDDKHKLTAVLKLNEKELQKFPFYGSGEGIDKWTELGQRTDDYEKASYTITNGGKYELEFYIDGNSVEKVDFSIVQAVNKNNVSGVFINDPMEKLGMVSAQNISYGKPDPNSSFIFKFYEAVLDPERGFVDATPFSVRLMKANPNGQDTYLAGYIDEELSHNSKWALTDNIFLRLPGERYNYIMYKDIVENDGKYYIDLFYKNDSYRYNFEVKDGAFISSLSDRSKPGICWIEREYFSLPKYEGFRPTANISGVADNINMSIGKDDGGSIGKGKDKPVIFSDGQKIHYSLNFNDEKVKNKYMHRLTEFTLTLKKGNEIIAQNIDYYVFTGASKYPSLVMNPDKTVMIAKEGFTHVFMDAFSKLPAGNHNLKLIWEIASGDDSDLIGVRTITYQGKTGNPKFTAWAKGTKEQKEMSRAELGEVMFLRSPSHDWVYYENNCGTIVWLRQDEYKEYYLYSGDLGKFDRGRGYIEQWNFGTLKWNSVKDFDTYKTIYKLSANEIAMLHLKQVPKEATEKLKEIVDVEFKDQNAFLAKVTSLIGEEVTKKHEDLLVQSASIDYVKICN